MAENARLAAEYNAQKEYNMYTYWMFDGDRWRVNPHFQGDAREHVPESKHAEVFEQKFDCINVMPWARAANRSLPDCVPQ